MSGIKSFQCPSCGSPVTTDGTEKEVKCAYCGTEVIVPEELRVAPQPQPQPMQWNYGSTYQPPEKGFQNMVTADNVVKATIGFTAASFILPIVLTCVILAAVGGILFYVFSNVNSTVNSALNQSNPGANAIVTTRTAIPSPTEPIPTPVPFTKVLFKDDFSSSSSGLPARDRNSKYTLEYKGGKYHILINEQGHGQEVSWDGGKSYTDVSVEADMQLTLGPSDGLMGVTCRDDTNGNFYSFEFSQNGTYGIFKYSNDSGDALDEGTLDPNTVNLNDVNHIEGICSGSTLTLLLNGQVLSQVQDSDYPKGVVGMTVRTGSSGNAGEDVLISDFVVKGP